MISGLFQSKNQKLVKKWKAEHLKMVELAHKVLGEYAKGEHDRAKKYLKDFSGVAMDHITSEDVEFFKLLHDPAHNDHQTEKMVEEFKNSFGDTKKTLMQFLAKYTLPETPLDNEFFETFSAIVKILGDRIDFEESNLYFRMSLS